jgi:hypothetical protein
MASTYTPLGIEKMATGENAGTWGSKTNANLDLIEQIFGGYKAVSIAGVAQTTPLTVSDGELTGTAQARMIEFTGVITGNQVVTIPNDVENFYILKNSTSGSFTVEFKYVSASGFTFSGTDKGTRLCFANGTTVVDLNAAFTTINQFKLPASDGTNGQAIVTDGSGTLSFGSAGITTGKAIAMAIVFG